MAQAWGSYSSLINVNELTEYVRHATLDLMAFAQLANAPTGKALGLGAGDTVQYTYWPRISVDGGELDENDEIPEGSITPVKGTYTVKEYGNSIKWTGKLEDLSRLSVEDDFVQSLVEDCKRLDNKLVYDQVKLTYWTTVFNSTADEFKTNNTPATAANEDLTLANLRFLRKKARANLIPTFDGESYVVVTGVNSADTLAFDSAVTTMLQYDSGRSALNGEIGRIAQCRIVEDTHKIGTIGSSVSDEYFLVGADCVIDEVALPWEIREEVSDFRRKVAVAWYGMKGVKKILDQTNHSKEHAIRGSST